MHLSDHSHFSSAALANVLHRSPSPCRLIFDVTELAQRAPQKIRGGKRPNPRQRCEEVANYYHVGLQRKAWHKAINSYQGEPLDQSCTFHSRCIWRKIYRCVIIELWWPYNYTCWLQQAPATHPLHIRYTTQGLLLLCKLLHLVEVHARFVAAQKRVTLVICKVLQQVGFSSACTVAPHRSGGSAASCSWRLGYGCVTGGDGGTGGGATAAP